MPVHPPASAANDLDWNLVRTFVAVADSGSLSGAARHLRLAHPTVARHIQQLEGQLGLTLFDRTKQGLALNRQGTALADQARGMQAQALAFERLSDSVRSQPLPLIRITVAELLVELVPEILLTGLAEKTAADGAGIPVPVEFIVANEQLNLLQRQADIAVRHVRPQQQDLICRRVGEVPMLACASRAYLERHGPIEPGQLHRHRFIDSVEDSRFQRGAATVGFMIPDDRIAFRSDSLLAQRAAMLAGWGVAALPLPMLEDLPDALPAHDGDAAVAIEVWLAARQELRHIRALKAVFDHLGDALSERLAQALEPLPRFGDARPRAPQQTAPVSPTGAFGAAV